MCKLASTIKEVSLLPCKEKSITNFLDDLLLWEPESPVLKPETFPEIPEDWLFCLEDNETV